MEEEVNTSPTGCVKLHGKNDFAEISKNLARYRFENNFIGLSK